MKYFNKNSLIYSQNKYAYIVMVFLLCPERIINYSHAPLKAFSKQFAETLYENIAKKNTSFDIFG